MNHDQRACAASGPGPAGPGGDPAQGGAMGGGRGTQRRAGIQCPAGVGGDALGGQLWLAGCAGRDDLHANAQTIPPTL